MSFDVAALGRHGLIDPDANPQYLGDRWATSPRVVLFLRHFG